MKIRDNTVHEDPPELPMAPMIDIVFQLLIFFIMTFKITAVEGDFNIKMPQAGAQSSTSVEPLEAPITIALTANKNGKIARIVWNRPTGEEDIGINKTTSQGKFQELSNKIIEYVGTGPQAENIRNATEIEFDCDEDLHYEEAINAITAVSGTTINGETVKLIEKIKFRDHGG